MIEIIKLHEEDLEYKLIPMKNIPTKITQLRTHRMLDCSNCCAIL